MVFFVPLEVLGGKLFRIVSVDKAVADPDLKIRGLGGGGGRGGHPDPEIRGRPGHKKIFFRPFGPQFGLKLRGSPPPPGIRHCKVIP